jgi:hypothetical protein
MCLEEKIDKRWQTIWKEGTRYVTVVAGEAVINCIMELNPRDPFLLAERGGIRQQGECWGRHRGRRQGTPGSVLIATRGDGGVVFQHQALYIRQLLMQILEPTLRLLELEIALVLLVFLNYLVLDGL